MIIFNIFKDSEKEYNQEEGELNDEPIELSEERSDIFHISWSYDIFSQ